MRDENSPRLEVEVGTVPPTRVRQVQHFVLVEDVQQLSDPCSFDLPNDEGQFTSWLGYRHFPIKVFLSDPQVAQGRPVQRLWGVISDVEQIVGPGGGSIIRVTCYDKGWYLGSGVRVMLNIRSAAQDGTEGGMSLYALAQFLLSDSDRNRVPGTPNWDFAGILGLHPAAPRQGLVDTRYIAATQAAKGLHLDLGRLAQEIALHPRPYQITPIIQTDPGDTVADVLMRYAGLARCFLGVDPLGYLCIYQPDYTAAPAYEFHHHRPQNPLSAKNNVERSSYRRSGDTLYTTVQCFSTVIEGSYQAQSSNPNEGRLGGTYDDPFTASGGPVATRLPLRRQTFGDPQRYNTQRATERARWKWQQGLYASEALTYQAPGVSQQGRLYAANAMAIVHDDFNDLDRTMFVSRIELRQDDDGTRTAVTLKLPGLYFS